MSITFYEKFGSRPMDRTVSTAQQTLTYLGIGSNSDVDIYTAFYAYTSTTYNGFPRQRLHCEQKGPLLWDCTAEYGFSANTQTDTPDAPVTPDDTTDLGPTYTFDITAQQVHITQSKQTKYRWGNVSSTQYGSNLFTDPFNPLKVTAAPPDSGSAAPSDVGRYLLVANQNGALDWTQGVYKITGTSGPSWILASAPAAVNKFNGYWTLWDGSSIGGGPNYQQAIGVTQDRIEGCDIYYPHFEFGINVQVAPFTLPLMRLIATTCGKTNNAPWRGFATGQVLYLGATGNSNPDLVWTISHKFAVGENLVAVPVSPPQIMVPAKGAWEFLWCVYAPRLNGNVVAQTPVAAFVEKVYDSADFTLLGLGA